MDKPKSPEPDWMQAKGVWILQVLSGLLGFGGYSWLLLKGDYQSAFLPFAMMLTALIISVVSAILWCISVQRHENEIELSDGSS